MKDNIAIRANGLKKSFKDVAVLKDVSFEIEKGSIFALLGSNGAGKTTTIKILTTLISSDGGNATISGYDVIKQSREIKKEISLTGQFAAVDYILTGRENLKLIAKLRHLPDVDKKVAELLQRFDLTDAANRAVMTYSGGMIRRLDIAMSLLGSPSVIFLDEPTTGLDPQSRLAMWEIINGFKNAGITVFLTTQYLEEAERLADQIAILHEGKIVAKGNANELKKLLPGNRIELTLGSTKDLLSTSELLVDYKVTIDNENLLLTVVIDGSVKQMVEILNKIEDVGIEVKEFAQKQPTLEDAFLTIIEDKAVVKDVN